MKTSRAGEDFIKASERLRLKAYRDVKGVWTIGYGHTGKDVGEGSVIDADRALELLAQDLVRFEAVVNEVAPMVSQNRFDAFVSIAYNIGVEAFRTSTLAHKMAIGAEDAELQFLRWNKSEGKFYPGLLLRRVKEMLTYLGPAFIGCTQEELNHAISLIGG